MTKNKENHNEKYESTKANTNLNGILKIAH